MGNMIDAESSEQVVAAKFDACEQDGIHAVAMTFGTCKGRKILYILERDELARFEARLKAAKRLAFGPPLELN